MDGSDIIQLAAQKVVRNNGLEDVITLLKGRIEEIELPVKSVDVIVSEWMGTMLVAESMIDSVLVARQKYLKPDIGVMMPGLCHLFLAPICIDDYYNERVGFFNQSVYGVDMSCLTDLANRHFFEKPIIAHSLTPEEILVERPQIVWELDMNRATSASLEKHSQTFNFSIKRTGTMHGFGAWFDTHFNPPDITIIKEDYYMRKDYKQGGWSWSVAEGADDNKATKELSKSTELELSLIQGGNQATRNTTTTKRRNRNRRKRNNRNGLKPEEADGAQQIQTSMERNDNVGFTTLSTSPFHKPTHWKQVMFLLPRPLHVTEKSTVAGTFSVTRNLNLRRHFHVRISLRVMELSKDLEVSGNTESALKASEEQKVNYKLWM